LSLRVRQACLTAALLVPLGFAIMTAPPLVETSHAAGQPQRMLGPNFPAKVDSNGNGVPDAGDESIGMTMAGNQLTFDSRWHCDGSADNVFTLSNPDASGQYHTFSRMIGPYTQTMNAAGGGAPTSYNYNETSASAAPKTGSINFGDFNGDGVTDQIMVLGSGINVGLSLSFTQNAQDISIPWAQASLLGIKANNSCGSSNPQVWVPLADTNGDGVGDAIVVDLDGNGVPDPQFVRSPEFVPPQAPSMGVVARAILTLLLGATAAWFLARRSQPLMPQA
jgi:hypothetical protein